MILEEDEQEAINWLHHNDAPQSMVLEKMKKTAHARYKWLRQLPRPSTAEIFEKYPRLLDSGVVEQDFSETVNKSADSLFCKWPGLAPQLVMYVKNVHPQYKTSLDIIDMGGSGGGAREQQDQDDAEATEEHGDVKLSQMETEALAFAVLPLVLCGRARGKKGKCSVFESVKSFIDVKPEGTDMAFYLKSVDRETHPQPFLLVIGSRINPLQIFVIVERQALQFNTMTKAVDYCFKLIYVLDIEYQPACGTTWEFLQTNVYGIAGKCGVSTSVGVKDILVVSDR
ncbi:uncharacterized protein LOC117288083 [Asterias rubens]|uniref:uncharacterized protein LOC117288083 n=2 Tax=Asterias rubens TaxID=7604 RepID=UPI001455962B|nr:uncharacterized protein LOC117288083 [Asterias rubens]